MNFNKYRVAYLTDENMPSTESFYDDSMNDLDIGSGLVELTRFKGYNEPRFLIPSSIQKDIIERFMGKILTERYYASIIGHSPTLAANIAKSIIFSSYDNYGRKIEVIEEQIDKLIVAKSKTTKTVNQEITSTTIDDETTDTVDDQTAITDEIIQSPNSLLVKENETPNAGNNPNLLDDTYLSKSIRNEETVGDRNVYTDNQRAVTNVIGERKRTLSHLDENLELTVNDNDVESVLQLTQLVQDTYTQWLSYLDRVLFTYDVS